MPATDLERLVVQLSADIKGYENAMRRAQGVTNRQLGSIQKKATQSSVAIAASFARAGASIAAGLVTAAAVKNVLKLSEAATRIDNALKVAGLSGQRLEEVYKSLAAAAVANGAPIESLVTLYGRAAIVQKELGVTTQELLGFTENVAVALRVAGTDAQTASGALLQLSQALGSGVVRAEEFNSILEGALPIAQAAAAGLREASGSVAKLRQLVVDGKISSEAFFRAFEAGSVTLRQKAANATFTVAQSMNNLTTALIGAARQFNASTGASESLAGGINKLATTVSRFDVSGFVLKLQEMREELEKTLGEMGNADIFKRFNEAIGVTDADGLVVNVEKRDAETKIAGLERNIETLQKKIENNSKLGFDNSEALERLGQVRSELESLRREASAMPDSVAVYRAIPGQIGLVPIPVESAGGTNGQMGGPSRRGGARRIPSVDAVSLTDFEVPGGNSGKGSARRQDDFERETDQIRKRTEALQLQTAAQASVNPLINDYGYAVEYAAARQDLLTAAQDAGVKVTPQLEASIDGLASGYARAVVASERLAEQQDEIRQRAEDAMSTARDLAGSFAEDLLDGADASDVLSNSLKRLSSVLLNDVLDSIFKVNKSSGQSLLGSIFGGLGGIFGGGSGGDPWSGMRVPSFNGGGGTGRGSRSGGLDGKGGFMAMLHPRETVIDHTKPSALSMPRLPDVSAARAAASTTSITYAPTYDARGADTAAVARLELAMARDRADFDAKVLNSMRKAKNSLDWRGR